MSVARIIELHGRVGNRAVRGLLGVQRQPRGRAARPTAERIWYEEHPQAFVNVGPQSTLLWNFEIGEAVVRDQHASAIAAFIDRNGLAFLSRANFVRVVGRASSSGNEGNNAALSRDRARSAAVIAAGVLRRRHPHVVVEYEGRGISDPLLPSDTPRAWLAIAASSSSSWSQHLLESPIVAHCGDMRNAIWKKEWARLSAAIRT